MNVGAYTHPLVSAWGTFSSTYRFGAGGDARTLRACGRSSTPVAGRAAALGCGTARCRAIRRHIMYGRFDAVAARRANGGAARLLLHAHRWKVVDHFWGWIFTALWICSLLLAIFHTVCVFLWCLLVRFFLCLLACVARCLFLVTM